MQHRWSAPDRQQYLTVRICRLCDAHKLTHHEGAGRPWISYSRNGVDLGLHLPACQPGSIEDGYYWATIKHTGEREVVEIVLGSIVQRMGTDQSLELNQVDIGRRVKP